MLLHHACCTAQAPRSTCDNTVHTSHWQHMQLTRSARSLASTAAQPSAIHRTSGVEIRVAFPAA
eukprot:11832634-Alexandrium_andersonii.AAC.1